MGTIFDQHRANNKALQNKSRRRGILRDNEKADFVIGGMSGETGLLIITLKGEDPIESLLQEKTFLDIACHWVPNYMVHVSQSKFSLGLSEHKRSQHTMDNDFFYMFCVELLLHRGCTSLSCCGFRSFLETERCVQYFSHIHSG
jgi:hypothetical protein